MMLCEEAGGAAEDAPDDNARIPHLHPLGENGRHIPDVFRTMRVELCSEGV